MLYINYYIFKTREDNIKVLHGYLQSNLTQRQYRK